MNNLYLKITGNQKTLLNIVLYHELMMLEDRIQMDCTSVEDKEKVLEEINDIKDLLRQIREEL